MAMTACEIAHDHGEHRWADHVEASLARVMEAVAKANLTLVPDDSPDAYALDCEVPLRLDPKEPA